MRDIAFRMADDRSKVRFEVVEFEDGKDVTEGDALWAFDMEPAVVSHVIAQLSLMREAMTDPIPPALDQGKLIFPRVQLDPSFQIMAEGPLAKRFMIAIRHPGLGWLPFGFTKEAGQRLTDGCAKEVLRIMRLPPGLISTSGMTKL